MYLGAFSYPKVGAQILFKCGLGIHSPADVLQHLAHFYKFIADGPRCSHPAPPRDIPSASSDTEPLCSRWRNTVPTWLRVALPRSSKEAPMEQSPSEKGSLAAVM